MHNANEKWLLQSILFLGFEMTSTLESVEFYRMDLGLEEYVNPKSSTHLIQLNPI